MLLIVKCSDLVVRAQVIRCINIAVLWPLLTRTGDGITLTSALLTAWSGLRGIVGLALALYVLIDPAIGNVAYRMQAFFFMSTTLVLTVVVQGSLYGPLLLVRPPHFTDTNYGSLPVSLALHQQGALNDALTALSQGDLSEWHLHRNQPRLGDTGLSAEGVVNACVECMPDTERIDLESGRGMSNVQCRIWALAGSLQRGICQVARKV